MKPFNEPPEEFSSMNEFLDTLNYWRRENHEDTME
jgi:hypothetical protein